MVVGLTMDLRLAVAKMVGVALMSTLVSCATRFTVDSSLPIAVASAAPEYAELLERYVTESGVRYQRWKASQKDTEKLDRAVEFYANTQPPINRESALAWYLNAYNANILQAVAERYPIEGVLKGNPLFFKTTKATIAGRQISFDKLEQEVIRPKFDEPRIHFALNCASTSCPPLHPEPFVGSSLDSILERLTSQFINTNSRGVQIENGVLKVSRIFDWYADDFGGESGVIHYIRRYRQGNVPNELRYQDYDWSLNDAAN